MTKGHYCDSIMTIGEGLLEKGCTKGLMNSYSLDLVLIILPLTSQIAI